MSSPKKPKSRDPYQLQAQRNAQNRYTSEYNTRMMSGPRSNVFGSTQTTFDTQTMTDPNTGQEIEVQVPSTSFNFNPNAQQFQNNLWDSLNSGSTEQTVLDKYNQLYSPMLDRRRSALEQQRANQGINFGSDSFADLENQIYRGEGDIMNKWVLDAWSKGQQQRAQDFGMLQGLNTGMNVFGANPAQAGLLQSSDFQTASDASQADKWKRYEAEMAEPNWWDVGMGAAQLGAGFIGMPSFGAFGAGQFLSQFNPFGSKGVKQSDITPLDYNVHGPH